jgi:hypothetical protein
MWLLECFFFPFFFSFIFLFGRRGGKKYVLSKVRIANEYMTKCYELVVGR